MLSSSDLTFFRDVQKLVMPDTLNVVSFTSTSDSMGGFTSTSSSGSAMGRIGGTSWQAGEKVMAERLGVDKPYFVTFPFGTVVSEKDRVTVGTRTFEVCAVTNASYSTAVRCLCRELT